MGKTKNGASGPQAKYAHSPPTKIIPFSPTFLEGKKYDSSFYCFIR
jgi:hypothetical protein